MIKKKALLILLLISSMGFAQEPVKLKFQLSTLIMKEKNKIVDYGETKEYASYVTIRKTIDSKSKEVTNIITFYVNKLEVKFKGKPVDYFTDENIKAFMLSGVTENYGNSDIVFYEKNNEIIGVIFYSEKANLGFRLCYKDSEEALKKLLLNN